MFQDSKSQKVRGDIMEIVRAPALILYRIYKRIYYVRLNFFSLKQEDDPLQNFGAMKFYKIHIP